MQGNTTDNDKMDVEEALIASLTDLRDTLRGDESLEDTYTVRTIKA